MDFFGAPPPHFSRILMGDIAWNMFGEGEVDGKSGTQLEQFLIENKVPPGSHLHLSSRGGSLEGGLTLGRIIRAHKLRTYVGKKGEWRPEEYWTIEPGECMSAAALAFLGGDFRFAGEANKLGFHQFTLQKSANSIAETQVLSAMVIEYLRSMDVDTELFTLSSETPSDDILIIPEETLLRLNVIDNGRKKPKWSIESQSSFLYLKGEQETIYGINKFLIVFPAGGGIALHVIFDAGVNAEDVMNMQSDRLAIDGEYIPMHEHRLNRVNDSSRINATYNLDRMLIDRIKNASRVGMIFQFGEDAAIFQGFDSMPFARGAELLPGLLAVCRPDFESEGHL